MILIGIEINENINLDLILLWIERGWEFSYSVMQMQYTV